MDIANEDVTSFWKLLHTHQVRFIMVSAEAVNMQGFNRTTADINLYLDDTAANREQFGTALEIAGIAPKAAVLTMQFVPGWSVMYLGNGFPLYVMTSVKGLEAIPFDECLTMALKMDIEGAIVPFLNVDHLLLAKRAADQPKDKLILRN